MKELQQELSQGTVRCAYLLCGEEAYLKRQYEQKIKQACVPDDDTMNVQKYEGKGIDIAEIIDLAQTMPFFAEKRLIVIKDSGFFKSSCDELADYMSEVPKTTCLLFVEDEVDKRTRLYKAVKKAGKVVEFKKQDEKTLKTWILSMLKKENKQITGADLQFFLETTGTDMSNIYQELEKLLCYTYERNVITREDIRQICSPQITNQIFAMIDAMAEKKLKRALDLYYDLLSLKEAPLKILALISRQFNLLLQVKELQRLGMQKGEIASKTGVPPYFVGRYVNQSKGFTAEQLRQALEDSVQAEADVKMGNLADKLSVELLIVKYSRLQVVSGG